MLGSFIGYFGQNDHMFMHDRLVELQEHATEVQSTARRISSELNTTKM